MRQEPCGWMWLLTNVNVPNITELCVFKNGWGGKFYVYFLTIKNKDMFPHSKILLPLRHGVLCHPTHFVTPLDEFSVADITLRDFQASQVLQEALLGHGSEDFMHHRNLAVWGCHVEKWHWERESQNPQKFQTPWVGPSPRPCTSPASKQPLWWAASTLWPWPHETPVTNP